MAHPSWLSSALLLPVLAIYLAYHGALVLALDLEPGCIRDKMAVMGVHPDQIMPCMDSLGLTPESLRTGKKAFCVMKCVLINARVLISNGTMMDMDTAQRLIDSLPDPIRDTASEAFNECAQLTENFEPGEESCESYREFVTCMTVGVARKMCNG